MREARAVRQLRLRYSVRGPEWAFAVPQGDLDALEEVMALCSRFWNGINSLIVPIRNDGRMPTVIGRLRSIRDVEQLFVHERVSERAAGRLRSEWPAATSLHDGFDRHEMHPLQLFDEWPRRASTGELTELSRSARLRRIRTAAWGHIAAEDRLQWERFFNFKFTSWTVPHIGALMHVQTHEDGTPLLVSGRYMRAYEQEAPSHERYLWLFGEARFAELVDFWNCRSRLTSWDGPPLMIGAPREVLADSALLKPLADWVAPRGGMYVKPELIICADRRDEAAVISAFDGLGWVRYTGSTISHGFPAPNKGREQIEYQIAGPLLGGTMRRGLPAWTLATATGQELSVSLPPPTGFKVRGGGRSRLEWHNLPLPFPPTRPLTQAMLDAAAPSLDGVGFAVDGAGPWSFDLHLPAGFDALRLWGTGHGFEVSVSAAGGYGQALLGRLADETALKSLASEEAVAVLTALSPLSAKKLAQHLVGVLGKSATDVVALSEKLGRRASFQELRARTLDDVSSAAQRPKRDLFPAVEDLVNAGFVLRGRSLRCPRCGYTDWLPLRELDERIGCRACRNDNPLPVLDESGRREDPMSYRLDGLMARCMDQDLLPILLAVNALADRYQPFDAEVWPGLLFRRGVAEQEADLLLSDGDEVLVLEAKSQAARFDRREALKLTALCADLGARPGAACLHGTIDASVREWLEEMGGVVLERSDLLA